MLLAYRVDDMTCGLCATAITRAVLTTDPDARVTLDVAAHRVAIEPGAADAPALANAIAAAGYTPIPVAAEAGRSGDPRAGACCCGSGATVCRA